MSLQLVAAETQLLITLHHVQLPRDRLLVLCVATSHRHYILAREVQLLLQQRPQQLAQLLLCESSLLAALTIHSRVRSQQLLHARARQQTVGALDRQLAQQLLGSHRRLLRNVRVERRLLRPVERNAQRTQVLQEAHREVVDVGLLQVNALTIADAEEELNHLALSHAQQLDLLVEDAAQQRAHWLQDMVHILIQRSMELTKCYAFRVHHTGIA